MNTKGAAAIRTFLTMTSLVCLFAASLGERAEAQSKASLDALVKAAKTEGSVMVYHTAPMPIFGPLFEDFQKKFGIRVDNFHATGSPLGTRFASEADSGKPQADVLSLSESALFAQHAKHFQELNEQNLPNYGLLGAEAKLNSGLAITTNQASFVVGYNTGRVKQSDVPRTWRDLTDPKWKGETLFVDPRSSATYRLAYHVLRQRYPDILGKMAQNDLRVVESGTPAVQQLAAGSGSIAYIHYGAHALPLMAKGAPINYSTIEGPEMTRSVWLGAVKGPHPNAARLFINYMTEMDTLKLYCKVSPDSKTTLDRDGKRTGCMPFTSDVIFLPDEAVPKEAAAAMARELKLQ